MPLWLPSAPSLLLLLLPLPLPPPARGGRGSGCAAGLPVPRSHPLPTYPMARSGPYRQAAPWPIGVVGGAGGTACAPAAAAAAEAEAAGDGRGGEGGGRCWAALLSIGPAADAGGVAVPPSSSVPLIPSAPPRLSLRPRARLR